MRKHAANVFTLCVSLILCFLIAELGLRAASRVDADGNVALGQHLLLPYRPPVRATRETLAAYRQRGNRASLVADSLLGWVPRPGACSQDGLYCYDTMGARTDPRPADAAGRGEIQVVLVGDSFTHGDEVAFEDTWGAQLQEGLRAAGVDAEVVNLGVPGYGIDQALLRWRQLGPRLHPRFVVLGVPFAELGRVVNVVRPLYTPGTGLPFTKPRFVLRDGRAVLVNAPAFPPERLPGLLDDPARHPLLAHEHFFDDARYVAPWWRHSRLLRTAYTFRSYFTTRAAVVHPEGEPAQIARYVARAFAEEAAQVGAAFVLVELPTRADLYEYAWRRRPAYAALLDVLERDVTVLRTSAALAGADVPVRDHFVKTHYARRANAIVAAQVQRLLQERLSAGPR